ncbi:hypothetical protein LTR85_006892 [Meristemomyces frigidus]|nr:hypothetical protein LTR85_006892 [Meristemomyces frigidus]
MCLERDWFDCTNAPFTVGDCYRFGGRDDPNAKVVTAGPDPGFKCYLYKTQDCSGLTPVRLEWPGGELPADGTIYGSWQCYFYPNNPGDQHTSGKL